MAVSVRSGSELDHADDDAGEFAEVFGADPVPGDVPAADPDGPGSGRRRTQNRTWL
jgi:hypothetical protein